MVITICACAQHTRQARTEAWQRLASVSSKELPFYQRGWWAHSIILREGERREEGEKGRREGEGEGGKYFMGEEWDSRSTKYKGLFHMIEDRNAAQEMGWHPRGPSCVANTEDFVRMFVFNPLCPCECGGPWWSYGHLTCLMDLSSYFIFLIRFYPLSFLKNKFIFNAQYWIILIILSQKHINQLLEWAEKWMTKRRFNVGLSLGLPYLAHLTLLFRRAMNSRNAWTQKQPC